MAFDFGTNVSALAVFLQGILSFFSPCVLPLLPIYLGYLSGGVRSEDGTMKYPRAKTFVNTIAFTLGISAVFFILGFGFSGLGALISQYKNVFIIVSAVIMIVFGLILMGVFKNVFNFTGEKRLPFDMNKMASNPVSAFILGFTFSFGWTPCIGPIMTSVLLKVSSAESRGVGLMLITVYILGFIIPFLITGLFTAEVLNFFRGRMNILKYTTKIGGALLIIMGIFTLLPLAGNRMDNHLSMSSETKNDVNKEGKDVIGKMDESVNNPSMSDKSMSDKSMDNPSTSSMDSANTESQAANSSKTETSDASQASETAAETAEQRELVDAFDLTLKDQNGVEHKLSDYKGKVVFLNFWATWCPPCRAELPDIQALYEKHGNNTGDVIVLGITAPKMGNEQDVEGISKFLSDNGYTYPVLMDESWNSFNDYQLSSFPTTYMINKEGKIFGYVQGGISAEMMDRMVEQTLNNKFER